MFAFIDQGIGCAQDGNPGVYSRVSAASDWIHSQICSLSENPPPECGLSTPTPGKRRIRIDVQYGETPSEVEWEVKGGPSKTVVASSPAGSVTELIQTSEYVYVEPGEYEFKSKKLDDGIGKF